MKTLTAPQAGFIAKLAGERDASTFDPILVARLDEARIGSLPFSEVTGVINTLKAIPRKPVAGAAAPATPGYYATPEKFVVVVKTKDGQRTYAKTLEFHVGEDGTERPSWDYAQGVGKTLAGMTPLTPEQVKEFGYAHGYCLKCLKALTDPKSVERGAGPTCWKKLVGAHTALAA